MNTIQSGAGIENSQGLRQIVVNSKVFEKPEDHIINKKDQKKILSPSTTSTEKAAEETLLKNELSPDILEDDYAVRKQSDPREQYKGININLLI